ncbi:hypothetical protein ACCC88_17405, partial [Sphingomonas sp. Sphisp140]
AGGLALRIRPWLRARTVARLTDAVSAPLAGALLLVCMFVADRVGLIALIASGYRLLAYLFLAVFVLPLLTIGLARLLRRPAIPQEIAA